MPGASSLAWWQLRCYSALDTLSSANPSGSAKILHQHLGMRTRGDPKTVVTAVRRELSAIDSNLEAVIEDSQTAFTNQTAFVVSRLGAIGSAIIGILGLLMASVGIYGTVGFAVTQRTHEIGVRMVLGGCCSCSKRPKLKSAQGSAARRRCAGKSRRRRRAE